MGSKRLERAESLLIRHCRNLKVVSRASARLALDAFADPPWRDILDGFPGRRRGRDARPHPDQPRIHHRSRQGAVLHMMYGKEKDVAGAARSPSGENRRPAISRGRGSVIG
jgi:hypothetical protein